MKTDDLVTIIVPVYNTRKYLNKCVESLCAQSYKNIQVILIDDGSTDGSGEICKTWQSKDKRVTTLYEMNKGQGSARNLGLNHAKGKYIVFVDSDDFVSQKYIEDLYKLLVSYNADVSCCNCDQYDENGKYYGKYCNGNGIKSLTGVEAIESMWYQGIINIGPWGKMYKSKLWNRVRFEEKFGEDYATMHYIYEQANKIEYTYKVLYHYLIRMNSDIHSFNPREVEMLNTVESTLKYASEDPILYKAALHKGIRVYFHVLFQLPKEGYCVEKKRIKKFIKKNRLKVLNDGKSSKKAKLAILLSFCSLRLEKSILRFMKKYVKDFK